MATLTKANWQEYCATELTLLTAILDKRNYKLDVQQPHLKGERFLMQAATTTGGVKLILFGYDSQGKQVVIKATREAAGQAELRHERRCREVLHQLKFAAEVFHTPPQVDWFAEAGFLVSIQEYIDQVSTFLDRSFEEQFMFALSAFKAQESTHATTSSHRRAIAGVYEERASDRYLKQFEHFSNEITANLAEAAELRGLLTTVLEGLQTAAERIDQYCGFLTHTDFVPHNIRIASDNTMFLLDHSSITFGNKHEGWARFINFMTLYNPPLAEALTQYVADNRTPEESESLRLMRLYRLGELMWYYQNKLPLSEGDLYELNKTRVFFWADIMRHVLENKPVSTELIDTYKTKRDQLRSEDEKERQKGLH